MKNGTSDRLFLRTTISLVIAVTLAACGQKGGSDGVIQTGQIIGGGTKDITDVQPVGGFLPNPSLLRGGNPGEVALNYRSPALTASSYDKVILDSVTIWAASDSNLNAVPPAQRQTLADTFHADLYNALAKRCQMVTVAAPGTLRLRIALVDVKTPNATINTIATYAPYVSAAYSVTSLAFNNEVGFFAGTATAEGYAIDAMGGTLLWEGVDKRGGTTAALENTLNTWLDVHHAFEAWSAQAVSRLQQLGICRKSV